MSGCPGETTAISALDAGREVLLYRDRDVTGLIAHEPYEAVWGLLVDGALHPALPPDEPFPFSVRTGDCRVDVQTAVAQLAPVWGYRSVLDIGIERLRDDLARASALVLSFIARAARGEGLPAVPEREVDAAGSLAARFLVRWRGEAPAAQVTALDGYLTAVAEHGLAPSTRAARLGAARGADAAACLSAAIAVSSGALAGGMGVRALALLEEAETDGNPAAVVTRVLDAGGRLWGFGQSPWGRADPRAPALRALCARLEVPRLSVAAELERAATQALQERAGGTPSPGPNVWFWGAVLLDFAGVPARMFPAIFASGRAAGWSAHIVEQARDRGPDSPDRRHQAG